MRLGELLDVSELRSLIQTRHILRRNHPTLPLAILNYSNACLFDNYWPETAQICRGLIVNPVHAHEICADCEIVSRPFHKFFGLNHSDQPLYQEENLPLVIPTVTEKMDGWFGILWSMTDANGQYQAGIASRGSFDSPGAKFATDKLGKLIKYGAIHEFPKGYSAIFEIIFKEGKIVVDYPFEGLVLLGLVNNETGEELPYDDLFKVWAKILTYSADGRPWIRLVKAHTMSLGQCINTNQSNFEGYVLSYPRTGTWPIKIKVKLEEYKRLHKLITGITPQQIWKSLQDPTSQWLDPNLKFPKAFRDWVTDCRSLLYNNFHRNLKKATESLAAIEESLLSVHTPIEDMGKHVAKMAHTFPGNSNAIIQLYHGKIYEAYTSIWNEIRPTSISSNVFYIDGKGE